MSLKGVAVNKEADSSKNGHYRRGILLLTPKANLE